jgi:predicted metal-dependent hydrolase
MSEEKIPQEILVCKVEFEFPEDFKAYWNPAKPVFSQLANGAFLLFPHMEPIIIDGIR